MTTPFDPTGLPALSVIGTPSKRSAILELAAEADRRGFAGLASPGVHGNLALCGSLAHVTTRIPFFTSIQPIYHSHPNGKAYFSKEDEARAKMWDEPIYPEAVYIVVGVDESGVTGMST